MFDVCWERIIVGRFFRKQATRLSEAIVSSNCRFMLKYYSVLIV